MQKDILRNIQYFQIFSYFPNFLQLHTFFPNKISEKKLKKNIDLLVQLKKLHFEAGLYTGEEYDKQSQNLSHYARYQTVSGFVRDKKLKSKMEKQKERGEITKNKVERISKFINLLAKIPQIQLIGLSGSAAMYNTAKKDDVDLFVISSSNRIWTARLYSLILALLFGLRRRRIELNPGNKICLNLFFDEKDMEIPKSKKNYFIAHEIIQMKPLIIKNNIYFRFLQSNKWVFDVFPNARYLLDKSIKKSFVSIKHTKTGDWLEKILKNMQLWLINRHKTTEIITDTQLWFFPDDFEKKLPAWARKKYNIK
jgi:hypothetical protein